MSSSNVGNAQTYEAGDQRNESAEEKQNKQPDRFEEGKENAHDANDPSTSTVFRLDLC